MPFAAGPLFDCEANVLAGIAPHLCIDQTAQQTVLKMDNKGTIAAAVTEMSIRELGGEPDPVPTQVFRADRPYLLTISHIDSG